MNLKEISEKLMVDSMRTPPRGLSAIAEAEKYLQQAYEGRYFFELIQNVRDANKETDNDGDILIELNNEIVSISNTGAEFNEKGIESITTIGQSTKHSQDYIGFKGIGFKSVQEITENPKIVTRYGSVCFDRNLTLKKYENSSLKESQIPLFYFPHFDEKKLSRSEMVNGVVTKIELPIKENVTEEEIIEAFTEINAKQLILLGNIRNLQFRSENYNKQFTITKDTKKKYIDVKEDDGLSSKFRYFTPKEKAIIPSDVIHTLEGKERELFKENSSIDISIVLELDDRKQIIPFSDSKLYLFYPLQISSGFRFIIHSYFIVNPERTALRNSPLNNFLLEKIGEFIGREMLGTLKATKINTNRILCFKRNSDAKTDVLYNTVVKELSNQRFIYESSSQKYFLPSEVIVADGFDKGLFPEGKLGGKQLIYTEDKEVIRWLQEEFNVPYLSYEDIENQIEIECKRQARLKKTSYFQKLYNYVSQNQGLNLTGKKVLLTNDWVLVSSEDDVFYGGGRRKPITLASSIRKHIYFINKGIKITDFREGKSRTGIIEYNTYELVRRLLKLFNEPSVPNQDVLNAIYNLQPFDTKSELDIREKILLPIKRSVKWLSPISNPIYIDLEELRGLYPNGNFVDEGYLSWTGSAENSITPREFLRKFGAWEIPAVYISPKDIAISPREKRDKIIQSFSNLVSRPYYLRNDRILDNPVNYQPWFTNTILDNWNIYESFLASKSLPPVQYSSNQSYYRPVGETMAVRASGFIEELATKKWIVFSGEAEAYSVADVIGISYQEFIQPHNKVIGRYLKLLPISFELKKAFITAIGLVHLDGTTLQNFTSLLNQIHRKYQNEIPISSDFTEFYNRILSKLFVYFYINSHPENIIQIFKSEYFLAYNDVSNKPVWAIAKQIFYIDDKPNYDLLPLVIKEKIQPRFTNRDKNTFGKLASKIGKRFSTSIHRQLVETNPLRVENLLSYFQYLPEAIAILESKTETVLTDYLELLKTIQVYESENLQVKISIDDSDEVVIEVNHFVNLDQDYNIHLSISNVQNRNRQLADSICELFNDLLGRDLRGYNSDLLRFLNSPDKREYLEDYDILNERVIEIRNQLQASELTKQQAFWDAVLNAKQISNRKDIFIGNEININGLSGALDIGAVLLQKIQNEFDFDQFNDPKNISLLAELLKALSLTVSEINKFMFPKFDFRYYFERTYKNLKDKFEFGFNAILHGYLKKQGRKDRENYQDFLDQYRKNLEIQIQVETFDFDVYQFFLKELTEKFSFLKIGVGHLDGDYSFFNPVSIYSENDSALRNVLDGQKFTNNDLQRFLIENKRRSLMYFCEIDFLSKEFENWLEKVGKEDNSPGTEISSEDFLNQFFNQSELEIVTASTSNSNDESPNNGSGGGGSGRRPDGGANQQAKEIIGIVAEKIVYEKLKTLYPSAKWISKFASKIFKSHIGFNPEGQDGLGYDIEYLDKNGNKYYIEVKGRSDSQESFEITMPELNKAYKEREFYKIFFVTNVLDNIKRGIKDLGNLFLLEEGDFFSNNRFKAVYRNFEIKFKETDINEISEGE